MDNLMKFIDESEPGKPPHVMTAVDQNDQVRVWQIRTIYKDEAITDDGGAYLAELLDSSVTTTTA